MDLSPYRLLVYLPDILAILVKFRGKVFPTFMPPQLLYRCPLRHLCHCDRNNSEKIGVVSLISLLE